MIQLHLHHLYCSFLDDWRPDEAEEDLRPPGRSQGRGAAGSRGGVRHGT
jgi:hypothetical protein